MKPFSRFWAAHFLWLEFGVAALVAAAITLWAERFGGTSLIHQVLNGNRGAVYGTLASIFGSLLGFILAAVAIVLGYSQSERLEVVRRSRHYSTLWKVFSSSMWSLGFATVIALTALILDRDTSPVDVLLYVLAFSALLATLRVLRAIWVVEQIIGIVTVIRPDEVGPLVPPSDGNPEPVE